MHWSDPLGLAGNVVLPRGSYEMKSDKAGEGESDTVDVNNSGMDVTDKGGEDGESASGFSEDHYTEHVYDGRAATENAGNILGTIEGALPRVMANLLGAGLRALLKGLIGRAGCLKVSAIWWRYSRNEDGSLTVEFITFSTKDAAGNDTTGTYEHTTATATTTKGEDGKETTEFKNNGTSTGTWKRG